MNLPPDFPCIDWTVAPDPHEIEQLRRHAQWPLWEKLEWLESAQIIVQSLENSRSEQARLARDNQEN